MSACDGFDRVVQQVGNDRIERIRIDRGAGAPAVIAKFNLSTAGHPAGFDQVPQPLRRRDQRVVTLLPFGLQPGQQAGDLADRSPHRRQHVTLEFRIVRIDFGIGQKH